MSKELIDNSNVGETGIASHWADGSTIVYDKNFPNGSPQAGQDVMLCASRTVALATPGYRIEGKLLRVDRKGICQVQRPLIIDPNNTRLLSLHEETLQKLYDSDAKVRALADSTHARRLMPGPACFGCMEMAAATVVLEDLGLDNDD